MKNQTENQKFPRRAWIVRLSPLNGYCDTFHVQACNVLRMRDDKTAVCLVRVGAEIEERSVSVDDLASTQARAIAKVTLGLHSLAARPLPEKVAGMTAAGA